HARYGRFVMIMDNYGAHNNLDVRRYVKESRGGIVLKRLPVGAPHLNAIEECWRQMKKDVATIYYETVGDLRRALYAYIRRKRFDLDVFAYLQRTIP
ncbi:MAG: transposase, partial [Nitrosopumilus sp.]|nr:transposase [Nitrosopumilus sp.]